MSELSYLEKLLDGVEVEWKTLKDVCDFKNGFAFKSSLFKETGLPIVRITNIDGFNVDLDEVKYFSLNDYKEDLSSFEVSMGNILIAMSGATTGKVGIYKKGIKCYLNQRVGKFIPKENILNNNYLYHFLLLNTETIYILAGGGAQPNLSSNALMSKLLIPIPCPGNPEKSLAIQSEIVRILDKFTALTAELTAELNMRKKQYNYYRDQLLSFEEGSVEWKTLEEVLVDKFWIMPATPKFDDNGEIPYITSKNISGGNIDFERVKHISRDDFLSISKNRPILKGDFLISMIGTIGEIARVKCLDPDFYGQNMYLIRLNEELLHPRYFLHFFDSPRMKFYFKSVKNNSGQGYLKANNIDGLSIPLPSIDEQQKIAFILDKFDTLTNSITEGLPREIELRQKQYEYYRDLLFSFPKPETVSN
ncbi:TPA: restriction endonuclease subunit S [Escherichia coli]|nr:restriction endonuclease subunit S [Escherichia coli]